MSDRPNEITHGVTWIVVADSSRADIYSRQMRHSPLEAVQSFAEPDARSKEQELSSDAPGRTFDRAGEGRHAMEPDHTGKQQLRTAFAHRIVEALADARKSARFGRLILIAAPTMLGELRARMDQATAKLVVAEFDKELVGHDPAAIVRLIDAHS